MMPLVLAVMPLVLAVILVIALMGISLVGFPAYRSGGVFAQSVYRDAVLVIT